MFLRLIRFTYVFDSRNGFEIPSRGFRENESRKQCDCVRCMCWSELGTCCAWCVQKDTERSKVLLQVKSNHSISHNAKRPRRNLIAQHNLNWNCTSSTTSTLVGNTAPLDTTGKVRAPHFLVAAVSWQWRARGDAKNLLL